MNNITNEASLVSVPGYRTIGQLGDLEPRILLRKGRQGQLLVVGYLNTETEDRLGNGCETGRQNESFLLGLWLIGQYFRAKLEQAIISLRTLPHRILRRSRHQDLHHI